jgi:hypothetical protein
MSATASSGRATGRLVAPDAEAVAALREQLADHERRLQALERRHGVRDDADRELLSALVAAVGDRSFVAKDVLLRARLVPPLADALQAVDVDTVPAFGYWLRQLRGVPIAGVVLTLERRRRAGGVWRLRRCEDASAPGAPGYRAPHE